MRSHAVAARLLTCLVFAGCASTTSSSSGDPFSGSSTGPSNVRIIVQNMNFADARLYAVRRGARTRLGTVGGNRDDEFTMRWGFSDVLRIEINLLAGPTCVTPEIMVDPGDVLELQIRQVFSQSSFCR
jgi:hypothetical protein